MGLNLANTVRFSLCFSPSLMWTPAPKPVSLKVDDASSAEDFAESASQFPEEVSPLELLYDSSIQEDGDGYQVC